MRIGGLGYRAGGKVASGSRDGARSSPRHDLRSSRKYVAHDSDGSAILIGTGPPKGIDTLEKDLSDPIRITED